MLSITDITICRRSLTTQNVIDRLHSEAKQIHRAARREESWIASRSLSSGAHSRCALARNDVKPQLRDPAARCARVVHQSFAPERAWGMPAQCTRSLVCEGRGRMHTSRTGPPESPGIPARNGFNGLLRALPGDRAFLSPSPREYGASSPGRADAPPQDLTPASRRQDHTIWPSASCIVRPRARGSLTGRNPPCDHVARQCSRVHRIPPRVRDDRASAPFCGTGRLHT
jgi:hypothetical protein